MHTTLDLWSMLFVFMLATFVGFQVIQNVSRLLHTPLMSLTNAISAIAIVGSIIIAGEEKDTISLVLGCSRRRRLDDQHRQRLPDHGPHAQDVPREGEAAVSAVEHLTQASYLAAAALFVFSLRWLSSPKTARQGVVAGVAGMTLAVFGTLLHPEIVNYTWIVVALVVGTIIGVPLSWVPLTAVPQRTALSHAFGGTGRRPGRHGEVHAVARGRRAHLVPDVRDHRRGAARLPDAHRQPDGRRQAAGSAADAAHHLQEPERLQRAAGCWWRWARAPTWCGTRRRGSCSRS